MPLPVRRAAVQLRASFKAGITPSRIAHQFGVSQSDVRRRWRLIRRSEWHEASRAPSRALV